MLTTNLFDSIHSIGILLHRLLFKVLLLYFVISGEVPLENALDLIHTKMRAEDLDSLKDIELDGETQASDAYSVESFGDVEVQNLQVAELIDLSSPLKCRVKTKKKMPDGTYLELVCGNSAIDCTRPKHRTLRHEALRRAEPRVYKKYVDKKGKVEVCGHERIPDRP